VVFGGGWTVHLPWTPLDASQSLFSRSARSARKASEICLRASEKTVGESLTGLLTPLFNSTVNNRVTQSGPLADDASFQLVDVRDLGTIDSLLKRTTRCSQPGLGPLSRRPASGWDKIIQMHT